MTLTYEQVVTRNRRHRDPRTQQVDRALARAARAHGGLHREPHQEIEIGNWKQPGRRFGPSPLGPDHPKANKVTDSDGNARIMPLTTGQRQARYAESGAPYGFTPRQRRRVVRKDNHARAPFGAKSR